MLKLIAAVLDRRRDPIPTLLDRSLSEPHGCPRWKAETYVDLNFDEVGVDAMETGRWIKARDIVLKPYSPRFD